MTLVGNLMGAIVSAFIFLMVGMLLFWGDVSVFDSQSIFTIFGLLVIVFTLVGEYTLMSL